MTDTVTLPPVERKDAFTLIKGLKRLRYRAENAQRPDFRPGPGQVDVNALTIADCNRLIGLIEGAMKPVPHVGVPA